MNAVSGKSVLDGIPVRESGFLLPAGPIGKAELLLPVSTCSRCGAPIYGPEEVLSDDPEPIPIKRSCSCATAAGTFGAK